MRRQLLAVACATALTATACGSESPRAGESLANTNAYVTYGTISTREAHFVREEFRLYAGYLISSGAIAANTNLVTTSGKQTFDCKEPAGIKSHEVTSLSSSEYCPGSDSVVLTGGDINAALHIRKDGVIERFILAHELGHGEQNKEGKLTAQAFGPARHALVEEQATCLGGQIVVHFNPEDMGAIERLLETTPIAPDHGSNQLQAAAWSLGAHAGSCTAILP